MLKNTTIKTKLIIGFLLAGLIPMIIVAILSLNSAGEELHKESFNKLTAIRAIKKSQIKQFFNERMGDVKVYAVNREIRQAMAEFEDAFEKGGVNGDAWRKADTIYGQNIKYYMDEYGYYDIFFISENGDVVYSASKENDLGQNLATGSLAKSGLGEAYQKGKNGTSFIDFAWYDPSNEPASFVSTPVRNVEGKFIGVLAYQVSLKAINEIMQERSGMGKTGESYLVGADKRMRSNSFLDPTGHTVKASFQGTVQANGVDTEAATNGIAGKEGTKIINDYNGNPVLSSYTPVNIAGTRWVVISEIDLAEVDEPVAALRNTVIVLAIIFGIVVGVFALLLALSINGGIKNIIDQFGNLVNDVTEGNLSSRGDSESVIVDFKGVVEQTNDLIEAFVAPIEVMSDYVARISKGDIPEKITADYRGDFNEVKMSLNDCIDVMNGLLTETETLIKVVKDGKLDLRGSADKFNGKWGSLVSGLNELVEAFVSPINTTADYINKISKGEIPPKITEDYNGDFNEIKNSVNTCIDNLNLMLNSMTTTIDDQKSGNIESRCDLKGMDGAYLELMSGVNDTLDAVILPVVEGIGIMNEYAAGKFDSVMRKLPGKQIILTNGLNTIRNNILNVLNEMEVLVGDVKNGNMQNRGDEDKLSGQWKNVMQGFNQLIDLFHGILKEVTISTDQVASGALQVSDASQSLSQGATEQASSLEEITSSMQEIGSQTKNNAENASQANQIATTAREAAESGDEQMGELRNAMDEINESSKNINKIIKVIDEIAFQTNLLALNAAVEAARAGRHGKGFAVVAEEVRSLAERSAKAAKETAEMIEKAVKKAEIGAQMAEKTSGILNEIVTGSSKVTDIVAEIAAASNEQAQGVSQVTIGLSQVEQVTQQNTASAEQSAAAAEELSSQSGQLKGMVSRFKLKDQMTFLAPRAANNGETYKRVEKVIQY